MDLGFGEMKRVKALTFSKPKREGKDALLQPH